MYVVVLMYSQCGVWMDYITDNYGSGWRGKLVRFHIDFKFNAILIHKLHSCGHMTIRWAPFVLFGVALSVCIMYVVR